MDFLNEFKDPTTVIIKHNNACAIASSTTSQNSFIRALSSDKNSSFGGVVLINKKVDEKLAKKIVKNFFEVLVSPSFTKKAIEVLRKRKNLILINSKNIPKAKKETAKTVRTGLLVQQNNNTKISKRNFKVASKNKRISKKEYEDVIFAFKVVKHLKSNSIVLVKNKQTIGIGAVK